MDNNIKKHYCFRFIFIPVSLLSLLLSIILIVKYSFGYNLEKLYRDAIINTWYNNPIVDISLKRENNNYHRIKLLSLENKDTFCDCSHIKNKSEQISKGSCSPTSLILGCNQYNSSKIANKFFNSTLFISTYNGNYWTFYDRIRKNKYGELACKEDKHYILCGYLDIFKNPLCVLEGEACPLNNIDFSYNSNNEVIGIKYKINGNPEHYIVNKIIASEIEDADIFDINQILTYKNITHYKKREDEKLFKLNYFLNKNCSKKYFYRTNQFTNEPLPDWFDGRNIYFYNIIYPGNKYDHQIAKRHIFFFNMKAILGIRISILLIKLYFWIFICKSNNNKFFIILLLIAIIALIVLIVFNFISFIGAQAFYINVNEYIKEQQNKIENGDQIPFLLDIFNTILEIIILFFMLILYYFSSRCTKSAQIVENSIQLINNNENNEDNIDG